MRVRLHLLRGSGDQSPQFTGRLFGLYILPDGPDKVRMRILGVGLGQIVSLDLCLD